MNNAQCVRPRCPIPRLLPVNNRVPKGYSIQEVITC